MRADHLKSHVLIAVGAALVAGCSGLRMSPSHYGKFSFQGSVKTAQGKPVAEAWVKVRGWETLTDAQGKWKQEHLLHCGSLREHTDSFEENDAILVLADGFESVEEQFIVKHPSWFSSCRPEQTVAFETVLRPKSAETARDRAAPPTGASTQGGYSL